MLTVLLII